MKKTKYGILALFMAVGMCAFAQSNTLKAGESLTSGKILKSENGKYTLEKDTKEGVYNIYSFTGGKKYFHNGATGGEAAANKILNATLILQTDGNLVVYNDNKRATWDSKTQGFFDAKFRETKYKPVRAVLENDGSFKLYSATGEVVWSKTRK